MILSLLFMFVFEKSVESRALMELFLSKQKGQRGEEKDDHSNLTA
jgi:hypothetical protein